MSKAIPRRRMYGCGPGGQGLPRNGIQNFQVSFPEALETRNFWTLRNEDPTLTARPSAKTRRLRNCLGGIALGEVGNASWIILRERASTIHHQTNQHQKHQKCNPCARKKMLPICLEHTLMD